MKKMENSIPYPYPKNEDYDKDIIATARFAPLQNSWLDPYIENTNVAICMQAQELFQNLSGKTKQLIYNNLGKDNPEQFVYSNPLDPQVKDAYRKVFKELIHEVRDYPPVMYRKILLNIQNIFQLFRGIFSYLQEKPVVFSI